MYEEQEAFVITDVEGGVFQGCKWDKVKGLLIIAHIYTNNGRNF